MVALWQTECTAYMRRYERANKPVSSFMADIQKYLDLREEVGGVWVSGCLLPARLGGIGSFAWGSASRYLTHSRLQPCPG